MKDHGGFDHNTHGLRVVEELEKRYPDFPGLNLTQEVRRGIIRHSSPFDMMRMGGMDIPGPTLLEIQVVNVADEIAYDNHDLDDGLKSGLIGDADLKGVPMWDDVTHKIDTAYPALNFETRRSQTVRNIINRQVSDVIVNSLKRIHAFGIRSVEDLASVKERVLARQKEKEKDPEKIKTRELCIRAYELRQRGLKWKEVAALVGRSVHHTADLAWRGKRLLERRV